MTTAHRPTWAPAKGGEEQGGNRMYVPSRMASAKDQPGQLTLKFRQEGQASAADIAKRDLRIELEEKESKHFREANRGNFEEEKAADLKLLEAPPDGAGAGGKTKTLVPRAQDADDEEEDEGEQSSSDDEEDEEAELLAELERIKKERAEEAAKKQLEEAATKEKEVREELLRGNPLVNNVQMPAFQVKRRWDDDVVFRNQARGEPKVQKRFINDTIRSDFHRRFLTRYIK
ncbi:hypothetical protein WJX84_008316 [Apatococcus fuscideae]|uniref:Cwf15/Cwc15 cell cycle control protein n=1 Tax=Apatococcus fuscideae TaxID=2026836 RepID=A0AAW1SQ96_9CHLO